MSAPPLPPCPHCKQDDRVLYTPFRCQCIGDKDACVICRRCDLHMHIPTGGER